MVREQYRFALTSHFKKVHRKIQLADDMVEDEIVVLWFIKIWRYKPKDLVKKYRKIKSLADTVSSIVFAWHRNSPLSADEIFLYELERGRVDDKLHELNRKIRNRRPKWWEDVGIVLTELVGTIREILRKSPLGGGMISGGIPTLLLGPGEDGDEEDDD